MLRASQFIVGIILFIVVEVLRIYLPGVESESLIDLGHFVNQNIFYFRTIALLILIVPAIQVFMLGTRNAKVFVAISLIIALTVFLLCNYYVQAPHQASHP
ncbi:MAG TPA: hypothetical protein VD927_12550 [Chryseosolibacter sp.]|nr:hypothetical protein [Chryseosolibacter sp.]